MDKYLVAMLQLETSDNFKENLKKIQELLGQAMQRQPQLIVLPEMSNVIGVQNAKIPAIWAESYAFFQNFAKQQAVFIHCGSFKEPIAGSKKFFNTSLLFNPQGNEIGRYRKIHTFDISTPNGESYAESNEIQKGEELVVIDSPLGKLGFGICYDLRFPEMYQRMAEKGAEVIFQPANFTLTTGLAHWETLLRARAIENSCYLIAPNQWGQNKSLHAYGHSLVVDPWGTVIAAAGEGVGVTFAEIDLNYGVTVRQKMQTLENRKAAVFAAAHTPLNEVRKKD